jgi:hypothetical protein
MELKLLRIGREFGRKQSVVGLPAFCRGIFDAVKF